MLCLKILKISEGGKKAGPGEKRKWVWGAVICTRLGEQEGLRERENGGWGERDF